ncbi:DUF1643 domain-containing protein [Natribaculum luteum]|uniref:DUF1643 domain-containing protein n=1 Tax=Natribaculum luteum TaxID=1586232 RepID=A0ABD5P219_9EURY|nr:DUF1643 domain-containing protein [Natribaculum luteum]
MDNQNSILYPKGFEDLIVQTSSNDRYDEMGAVLSPDEQYRYYLWREWDNSQPTVAWLMANPSTADGFSSDATINRVYGYSDRWGYGSFVVANLFAYRSSEPTDLDDVDDPVGPRNDEILQDVASKADLMVGAWGSPGDRYGRPKEVLQMLDINIHALTVLSSGNPGHPLFKDGDLEPTPYEYND